MKKYLITFAAVLFAAIMTTTVFTSCSKSDDGDTKSVRYGVYPELSSVSTDISELGLALTAAGEYETAIKSVVGNEGKTENDAGVIAACDKVYESQKTEYAGKLTGRLPLRSPSILEALRMSRKSSRPIRTQNNKRK